MHPARDQHQRPAVHPTPGLHRKQRVALRIQAECPVLLDIKVALQNAIM